MCIRNNRRRRVVSYAARRLLKESHVGAGAADTKSGTARDARAAATAPLHPTATAFAAKAAAMPVIHDRSRRLARPHSLLPPRHRISRRQSTNNIKRVSLFPRTPYTLVRRSNARAHSPRSPRFRPLSAARYNIFAFVVRARRPIDSVTLMLPFI